MNKTGRILFSEQGLPLCLLVEAANTTTVSFQNRVHRFHYLLLPFPEYRDIPVANRALSAIKTFDNQILVFLIMSNNTVYNLVIQSPLVLISGSVIQHHTEPQVGSVRKHLRKDVSRMQVGVSLTCESPRRPGPELRAEVRSDIPGLKKTREPLSGSKFACSSPSSDHWGEGEMPHGWSILWRETLYVA